MAKATWADYAHSGHMDMRRPKWQAIQEFTGSQTVLYPGSYIDVSPSFVFEHVTYVDMDKRCPRFFDDPDVAAKLPQSFDFVHQDYREPINVEPVDLLISQYAGPISHYCKGNVKPGGHLLANNSHADAGIAALEPEWQLVGVVKGDNVSTSGLDGYFHTKPGEQPDVSQLIATQKGVGYTKTAQDYLFQRVQ